VLRQNANFIAGRDVQNPNGGAVLWNRPRKQAAAGAKNVVLQWVFAPTRKFDGLLGDLFAAGQLPRKQPAFAMLRVGDRGHDLLAVR
jgi:hypothetical protein